MRELNVLRKILNNIGWDLVRYREFIALLIVHDVDLVIDVGANEGQFIRELRFAGYRGQIDAYEPAEGPFKRLAKFSQADPKISCSRTALGAVHAELKMHAYDDSRFSSFLPLKSNPDNFREEIVPVTTLDTEFQDRDLLSRFKRPFLKIDTQGYERAVLEGERVPDFTGAIIPTRTEGDAHRGIRYQLYERVRATLRQISAEVKAHMRKPPNDTLSWCFRCRVWERKCLKKCA